MSKAPGLFGKVDVYERKIRQVYDRALRTGRVERVLSITGLIALIVSIVIVRLVPLLSSILWIIAVALIIMCYYRMFSRDHCQTLGRESEIS